MTTSIAQRAFCGRSLLAGQSYGWLVAAVCLMTCASGCRSGNSWFAAPGPLNKQQASAVVHDPYPDRDIAPYDAASRPPGYEHPLPEPVRNRIVRDSMPWLGR